MLTPSEPGGDGREGGAMRQAAYWVGLALLVFAGATAVAQLVAWLAGAAVLPVTLGSLWAAVSANSLVGFQALIENRVTPALWPPILWVLLRPAWLTLGGVGLLLLLLGRRRSRGGLD
jgi:hypothetical protein